MLFFVVTGRAALCPGLLSLSSFLPFAYVRVVLGFRVVCVFV